MLYTSEIQSSEYYIHTL